MGWRVWVGGGGVVRSPDGPYWLNTVVRQEQGTYYATHCHMQKTWQSPWGALEPLRTLGRPASWIPEVCQIAHGRDLRWNTTH